MEAIDKASHFRITDAKALLKRSGLKALQGGGLADQMLPDL
ncbi:MAG TPA: hypothetical protein VEZ59_04955 [Sphingopyxis sp.]|nr:hypothetical protein [Sphingopyxis sp.]